jgi:hypothetical protein
MFWGLDYTGCWESGIVRDGVGANSAGSPGPFNIYMHNMNNERFLHHWRSYTMYSWSSDVWCAATLGWTYETFSWTNYCMSAIR